MTMIVMMVLLLLLKQLGNSTVNIKITFKLKTTCIMHAHTYIYTTQISGCPVDTKGQICVYPVDTNGQRSGYPVDTKGQISGCLLDTDG